MKTKRETNMFNIARLIATNSSLNHPPLVMATDADMEDMRRQKEIQARRNQSGARILG